MRWRTANKRRRRAALKALRPSRREAFKRWLEPEFLAQLYPYQREMLRWMLSEPATPFLFNWDHRPDPRPRINHGDHIHLIHGRMAHRIIIDDLEVKT